jgi:PTH2 family peptidyl-tRNA hydrolase
MLQNFRFKQVIVVRTDLKMSRGKIAVQVAHAAVTAAEATKRQRKNWWRNWIEEGQCKVVVKVKNELELMKVEEEARIAGLPAALIKDRGLTELPPGTITCLGVGPVPVELIDRVTRKLHLL